MRAAWRERYGGPHVVEVREFETPTPTGDQVLVRVAAASVNRLDLDRLGPRSAFIRLFAGFRRPRVKRLGIDVAGVVEAAGERVTRFQVGDRVFGDLFNNGSGAFAEYVCAREIAFASIPDDMAFEIAATLPHSAVLALQGLRLGNGRTVGATDRALIAGLHAAGLTLRLDRRRRRAPPAASWRSALKLATDKTMGLLLSWKPFAPDDVEEIKGLVASGAVKPVIDRRFSLDEVAKALAYVEGLPRGKVVVIPPVTTSPP